MMSEQSPRSLLRVALVARGAAVAGGEVSLLTLARHLPAPWVPVLWVTEEGELSERAASLGMECVRGSWEFLSPRRPLHAGRRVREVARALDRHAIDLVHVNSPVEASEFVAASLWTRRPSLVHVRIAYERAFLRAQGLSLADEVIFNSRALREQVGWAAGSVVPNGVELPAIADEAARRALRAEFGVADGQLLLGQVGQVIEAKGVDLSLRALSRLELGELDWRLVVVGDDHQNEGAYRHQMESLVQELGLQDRVHFAGYRRDAQALMGALDLLLCPSRIEPFGRVLIEAMSQHVPAIAARVGGIPEVLIHGSEGLLVPAGDVGALTDAMRDLALDPARRVTMGRRGRARAEALFSARAHAESIAAIYERVAAPYLRCGGIEA